MKKLVILVLMFGSLVTSAQQNFLLDQNFWKASPDLATVVAEIEKGSNPAELNRAAFDPVVLAINNNASFEVVKYLIAQPGNGVAKPTHDSRIYLHWAASKGNVELVEYLIAKGSELNLEDSHGSTPIVYAASNGQTNTAVYDAFFKAGISPGKKYKDGANLLLLSIANDKDLTLTNYFVSKGMSLNDVDQNGNTAFNYACRVGDMALLKTLKSKGVNPTDNAILFAAQGARRNANTIDVYQYLIEDLKVNPSTIAPNGQNAIHLLAKKDKQTQIVQYFISKGVSASTVDYEGNTALMNASAGKDTELLNMLLANASNINAINKKGESAVTMAVKNGSPEILTLLLSKGADVWAADQNGNNLALHLVDSYKPAQQKVFDEKLTILHIKGLNLTAPQKDGSTLYHAAIVKNDLELLKKIASLNIDINARNADGMTVLHKAAMMSQDDQILKYLIATGAKKDIKTEFDETAYDFAAENELLKSNRVAIDFLK